MKLTLILFVIFAFLGCEDEGEVILEEMEYVQSPCRGICPWYEIAISPGGHLRYIGHRYVTISDTVYELLSNEQLSKLSAAFNECKYFSLKDEYLASGATDMETVHTSVKMGGRYKSVWHYFGDFSAPAELNNLYFRINTILNTQRWTGR